MPNLISLRSRSVDRQQETKLILQDMNDEDIWRYVHEVLALDIDCQYERFAGRDEQRHPKGPDRALSLNPSPPRRSARLSQQTAQRR
jgi:hypothetical protein